MSDKMARVILKIMLAAVVAFFSVYIGIFYVLIASGYGVNYVVATVGAFLFPAFWILLIFFWGRKKVLKVGGAIIGVYVLIVCANIGWYAYNESITIDTSPNINLDEYLPFDKKCIC